MLIHFFKNSTINGKLVFFLKDVKINVFPNTTPNWTNWVTEGHPAKISAQGPVSVRGSLLGILPPWGVSAAKCTELDISQLGSKWDRGENQRDRQTADGNRTDSSERVTGHWARCPEFNQQGQAELKQTYLDHSKIRWRLPGEKFKVSSKEPQESVST